MGDSPLVISQPSHYWCIWPDLPHALHAFLLNGVTVIDNQPVPGCTGGALFGDVNRDGPVYLQGDHTSVRYRNILLRPVIAPAEK